MQIDDPLASILHCNVSGVLTGLGWFAIVGVAFMRPAVALVTGVFSDVLTFRFALACVFGPVL